MSEQKPQEKTTQQKQQQRQKKCIIVKNSKVEDVAQRVASHVTMEQDGENVIVFSTQFKYRQQLIKDFGKDNVEIIDSDKDKFSAALAGQTKIAYAKFCKANELKDEDLVLVIIRSSPRDANVEPAKEFVKNVVKICYEDNEKHTCKFFVRGWLIKDLQELSKAGLVDKNQKETKQCRVFKRQDPWQKELPYKRSIECKVFVKKADIPAMLEQLQQFQNKVTCTFSNPAKFAERRNERRQDRRNKKAQTSKINKQRGQKKQQQKTEKKQQKKEEKIDIQVPGKKLTIFTESANVAKKLQETMKSKGFDLKIDGDKLYTEQEVEKVNEFAKQIKINGKKLQMKLE